MPHLASCLDTHAQASDVQYEYGFSLPNATKMNMWN